MRPSTGLPTFCARRWTSAASTPSRDSRRLEAKMTGHVTFITGGARSGKSRHAESLAAASGAPVVYIATMETRDSELEARVASHRLRRPAHWTTAEAPLDVAAAVESAPRAALILLDCLSLWVSNLLFAALPDFDD